MSEISQEMFSLKKKDKIQKNGEAGKTKSSFATITKRIHEISLQERLLKGSDNGSRTAKHSSSNPPNGRVGPSKPSNSPNGRVGPNMLPSPHSHSILFSDQIELTLISSRLESPSELYSLETAKNSFSRRKFGLLV
ncbi:hypothetical protein DY000_02021646 [Brassica cretica]|uniref:Uncharacterized protein n=1 Tax=Brassica cretica TaxID=69181 RepID=A0ABQ7EGN2_BRACR|nr:hypothetical protein DY000_02021646 [Brassica cretica]